jgi:hypothetical protein
MDPFGVTLPPLKNRCRTMPWIRKKRMTAKMTANRSVPIPNEGGFPPSGAGVFE